MIGRHVDSSSLPSYGFVAGILALTIVTMPAQTQQALAGTAGAEVEACARLSSALLALGHQV